MADINKPPRKNTGKGGKDAPPIKSFAELGAHLGRPVVPDTEELVTVPGRFQADVGRETPAPFLPTGEVANLKGEEELGPASVADAGPSRLGGSVQETTEPFTPAERDSALREAVTAAVDTGTTTPPEVIVDEPKPSMAPSERAAMQDAEKKYLTAFREYEQKKTIVNRLLQGKTLAEEKDAVDALKREYDETRIAYAKKINENVPEVASQEQADFAAGKQSGFEDRMRKAYDAQKNTEGKVINSFGSEVSFNRFIQEKASERQERVSAYLQFREVVRPLAQKKLDARKEALDARGKNVLEKSFRWIGKQNQKLEKRFGKNGARFIRAFVSAAITTGTVTSGAWVFAAAGIIGGGVLGGFAAKLSGAGYEKFARKGQMAAHDALKKANTSGLRIDRLDPARHGLEILERLDVRRDKLTVKADEERIQKRRAIIEVLTAVGVGAAVAGNIASLGAVENAADAIAQASPDVPEAPPETVPNTSASEGVTTEAPSADTAPESAPAAESESAPTSESTPETESTTPVETGPVGEPIASATIQQGEGFNHLFARLEASAIENPSAVTTHLTEHTPSQLSAEIKALVGGESALVHPGDQLFLDENQNLYFQRPGEEARLLMENTGNAENPIAFHDVNLELRATVVSAPSAPLEATSTVQTNGVSEAVQTPVAASAEAGMQDSGAVSEAGTETVVSDGNVTATPADAAPGGMWSLDEFVATSTGESIPAATEAMQQSVPSPADASSGAPGRMWSLEEFNAEQQAQDAQPELPSSEVPEVITNAYGVEITPNEPAAYLWKIPGTEHTMSMMAGGTLEEQTVWAQQYATQHPNSIIHFYTPVRALDGTLSYRLDAWDSTGQGAPELITDVGPSPRLFPGMREFPQPDVQQFISKLP